MANLCSCHLNIYGGRKDIQQLARDIERQNPGLIELFPWFEFTDMDYGLWEDTLAIESKQIGLSFGSKWNFPLEKFQDLVEYFLHLVFEGYYSEPACNIYGEVKVERGVILHNEMSPLDYYTEYDEDFKVEHELLRDSDYESFIRMALKTNYAKTIGPPYYHLEPLIIKRLKTKDLPLFINHQWANYENLFKERLKNG